MFHVLYDAIEACIRHVDFVERCHILALVVLRDGKGIGIVFRHHLTIFGPGLKLSRIHVGRSGQSNLITYFICGYVNACSSY